MSFSSKGRNGEIENLSLQRNSDTGHDSFNVNAESSSANIDHSLNEGDICLKKLCHTRNSSKCSALIKYRYFDNKNNFKSIGSRLPSNV